MSTNLKRFFLVFIGILVVVAISLAITDYVVSKKIAGINNELIAANKKIDDLKTKSDKDIQVLKQEIDDVKSMASSNSSSSGANNGESTLTISPMAEPKVNLATWKFKFSNDIDSQTLKLGNISLYSVSGGANSKKTLSNKPIKSIKYNKADRSLMITVDTKSLVCASCTWELDFTDKITDQAGNNLVERSFSL